MKTVTLTNLPLFKTVASTSFSVYDLRGKKKRKTEVSFHTHRYIKMKFYRSHCELDGLELRHQALWMGLVACPQSSTRWW